MQQPSVTDDTVHLFLRHLKNVNRVTSIAALTAAFRSWAAAEQQAVCSLSALLRELQRSGCVKKRGTSLSWSVEDVRNRIAHFEREFVRADPRSRREPAHPSRRRASAKSTANEEVEPSAAQAAQSTVREREQLEQNKGGIVMGAVDFTGTAVPIGGSLAVEFSIRNDGKLDRRVESITLLHTRNRAFEVCVRAPGSEHADFAVPSAVLPISFPVGQEMRVRVQFNGVEVGAYGNVLSVAFTSFTIARFLSATCSDPVLFDALKPVSAPKKKRKRRRRSPRADGNVVPGQRVPSAKRYAIPVRQYKISSEWRRAIAEQRADDVLAEYGDALSKQMYREKFERLLWCEEEAQADHMHIYTLEGANMRTCGPEKAYLSLRVEGLQEKRPSLMRGDEVEVTLGGEGDGAVDSLQRFRGVVHEVRLDTVWLKFHLSFHQRHCDTNLYHVEFVLPRMSLRLMHQGLELIDGGLRHTLLFPPPQYPSDDAAPHDHSLGDNVELFTPGLNEQQCTAVRNVFRGAGRTAPYLLYGPPGTGKTTTVVEMCAQLLMFSERRILVLAPTNGAADLICERLDRLRGALQHSAAQIGDMLRLMAYSRPQSETPPTVLPYTLFDEQSGHFLSPTRRDLELRRVVIATLATAAKLHNHDVVDTKHRFDCVLVDESGQALEPELLAPLSAIVKRDAQIVLAGDPQQLGPVVHSSIAASHGLQRSLLERLFDYPIYRRDVECFGTHAGGYDERCITMLTDNYRSHHNIVAIPNRLFYEGALQFCGPHHKTHSFANWGLLPQPGVPLLFHNVVGRNEREASSPSWFNVAEVVVAMQYVTQLVCEEGVRGENIGIIAPYHQQVRKLKKALRLKSDDSHDLCAIKVGSTEQFQGRERQIIVVSTVRSDPGFLGADAKHDLGFVANRKRFNVTITRAQALLIVIGNADVLMRDETWAAFLQYCADSNAVTGVPFQISRPEDQQVSDHNDSHSVPN